MNELVKSGEVIPPTPPVDLKALATKINDAHAAVVSSARTALSKAIACGEALIAARAAVADGMWMQWRRKHCIVVSDRTAQMYIQLAENKTVLEAWLRDNAQNAADQSVNAALRHLRGKPPQRKSVDDETTKLMNGLLNHLVNLPADQATQRAHRLVERLQEERLIE
jgi:hypothetical protein